MDLKIGEKGVDWTHVPEDRDKCWVTVNTAMKFLQITSKFLPSRGTFFSHEALWS
jgi:hypothetical protein